MSLPPQEQLKAAADTVAVPTAVLAWLKAIPIPDLAAFAALVYTVLRIAELVHSWFKKRRKPDA
jgi:hypothetical protein